jgi:hypothetical protein
MEGITMNMQPRTASDVQAGTCEPEAGSVTRLSRAVPSAPWDRARSVVPSTDRFLLPDSRRKWRTTVVFDTYWRFAAERQAIFFRRLSGGNPPWTDDRILSCHRFTNAYRASDRVSQYLINNVIPVGMQTPQELFFRVILFKLFNRISTWRHLKSAFGEVTYADYSFNRYNAVLTDLLKRGQRIYSAAYIMPASPFGEGYKHANHLRLIELMMKDELPQKIANAPTLKAVYQLLLSYPSIGPFLAYQYAIDSNYSNLTDFSEMDFVVPGPGAVDGIRKCFIDTGGLTEPDVIRAMADVSQAEFERLDIDFPDLWGRPLQLIDHQNLFCEVDKYARQAHPEVQGSSGRQRIKQAFKPSREPLTYGYPPKWRLDTSQPVQIFHTGGPATIVAQEESQASLPFP